MSLRSAAQHLATASVASRRCVTQTAGSPWGNRGMALRGWFSGFGQTIANTTLKRPARHLRMQPT